MAIAPRAGGRRFAWIAAMVGAAIIGGCGSDSDDRSSPRPVGSTSPPEAAVEVARAVADSLGGDLAGLVARTVAAEGPVAAVRICSEVAQERTAAHGSDGVAVRRVSDRLRNPENAPDPVEREALDRITALDRSDRLPAELVDVEAREGRDVLRYFRPIVVQQGCLACHGPQESMDASVREIITDRYPRDRATGYQVGDLRGLISVTVELDG